MKKIPVNDECNRDKAKENSFMIVNDKVISFLELKFGTTECVHEQQKYILGNI